MIQANSAGFAGFPLLRAGRAAVTILMMGLCTSLMAGCGKVAAPVAGAPTTTVSQDAVKADQLLASANKMQDPAQRQAAMAEALNLYDQASLQDPKVDTSAGYLKLLDTYSSFLIGRAGQPEVAVDDRRRLLTTARFVTEREPDPSGRTTGLLSIARRQIEAGDYAASAETLTVGYVKLADVPAAQRDPLVAAMTGPLAYSVKGRPQAVIWATSISNPESRAAVLARVAQMQLQTGDLRAPELAPFRGLNAVALENRSTELLEAAEVLRVRGAIDAAATAALAAKAGLPQRDDLLLTLVSEAQSGEQRDIVERAAFGITLKATRDKALFGLAMGNAENSRLSIAERLVQSLTDASQKAEVLSEVAARYANSHMAEHTTAATKQVLSLTSIFTPRLAKTRINKNLAEIYLRSNEFPKALTYARRVTDPVAKATVLSDVIRKSMTALEWKTTENAIGALRGAGQHDSAAMFQAIFLAARGHPGDIEHLANDQKSPGTRAWVLAYATDAYARRLETVKVGKMLANIDSVRAAAKSVADIQSVSAAAIYAYASAGQPDKAQTFLPDALAGDSEGYTKALARLAGAQAKTSDMAKVDGLLAWAIDDDQMTAALERVVEVLAGNRNFETAAHYAQAIPEYKERVATMHQLAMSSAEALDSFQVLDGQANNPGKTDSERQVILKAQGYTYYGLDNDKAGEAVPVPPRLASYTRQSVSDKIPLTTDEGRVFVIPMEYSAYNTKFVSQVNNTFRSIGERVFPVQAQGTRYPRYIHIESGVLTLETLSRRLAEIGEGDLLVRKGGRYVLNVPLLIGPTATLIISGTDANELRMNSETGVFIVNAGKLWFHDVTVSGWDPKTRSYAALNFESKRQFRPFVISWGGSVMNADGSHFHHLGFGGDKGYGFSYSQGPIEIVERRPGALPRPTGTVVQNSFEDLYFGFFTNAADDVALVGNEYKNNVIYGVDPHDFSQRLIIAYNTSYGALKKHGIIGSREVDDSWIVGNIVFDNHGTGIMLDRISAGNVVYANRVWGNGQEGMAAYESPCNIMAANVVFGNRGDAVKVRNSTDVGIFHNQLSTTDRTGVNIYIGDPREVPGFPLRDVKKDPYIKFVSVAIVDNTIDKHNGSGITATGFGAVAFKGNQFIGSNEKMLQGDLAPLTREVTRLQGEGFVVRSTCPAVVADKVCKFRNNGYMSNVVDALPPAAGHQAMCQGSRDADQETAEAGVEAADDAE